MKKRGRRAMNLSDVSDEMLNHIANECTDAGLFPCPPDGRRRARAQGNFNDGPSDAEIERRCEKLVAELDADIARELATLDQKKIPGTNLVPVDAVLAASRRIRESTRYNLTRLEASIAACTPLLLGDVFEEVNDAVDAFFERY
jgi:hypothetical protein